MPNPDNPNREPWSKSSHGSPDLLKQDTMPQTKPPASWSSGSYTAYFSPFGLTMTACHSTWATHRSHLVGDRVIALIWRVWSGYLSKGLYETLVPRHQTSLGGRRDGHRPSYARHAQSPRMYHDLLFLVPRRCSPPPSNPYFSGIFPA